MKTGGKFNFALKDRAQSKKNAQLIFMRLISTVDESYSVAYLLFGGGGVILNEKSTRVL